MVTLVMSLVSHDVDADTNGITWTKSHVWPYFNCLDLRNAMVSLMMPSASCESNANTNGITWPKHSCCILFLSWPKECNGFTYEDISIKWHQAIANGITLWNSHLTSHFSHLDSKTAVVTIDDSIGITWYLHLCHWCHMKKCHVAHLLFVLA